MFKQVQDTRKCTKTGGGHAGVEAATICKQVNGFSQLCPFLAKLHHMVVYHSARLAGMDEAVRISMLMDMDYWQCWQGAF